MIQKSKEMVRLPEIINDLAFHASQVLIESMNIDSASAENAGQAIADRMMRNWGGQSIYFPKGISGRASERDYQIYSECDGRNYAELAKKYNLTLQWIYKIVKRVHTEKQHQRRMLQAISGMAYSDKRYTPGAATGRIRRLRRHPAAYCLIALTRCRVRAIIQISFDVAFAPLSRHRLPARGSTDCGWRRRNKSCEC